MVKMKRLRGGFTLIELLVVISIIVMLTSVVLAAVSSARNKAKYVGVIQELRQLTTATELYYQEHGDYGDATSGTCPDSGSSMFVDPLLKPILDAAKQMLSPAQYILCASPGQQARLDDSYVVTFYESSEDGESNIYHLCIDSSGYNGVGIPSTYTTELGSIAYCSPI